MSSEPSLVDDLWDSLVTAVIAKAWVYLLLPLCVAWLMTALLLFPFGGVGLMLPRFIRDAVYEFIAKRRYRWFGKRDQCMVPTPELRSRFLA